MRKRGFVAVLLLAGLIAARPSAAGESLAAETPDVTELERLSVEWMQALESKDESALRALMAPEYALTSPGDPEEVRLEEWIGNAIGMDWTRPRYEALRVRVSGDHAVVSSRFYFHVSPIPFGLDSGLVDTWERRDGRWLVTGRYLGQSDTQDRIHYLVGFAAALLLWVAWAAWGSLSRHRKRRAATLG